MKKAKEESIRLQLKHGVIQPTQRRIGQRRYYQRLPEFKEMDTDMPVAKNIEGSCEPLK